MVKVRELLLLKLIIRGEKGSNKALTHTHTTMKTISHGL